MANMSYCRFRNTLEDFRDCYKNLNSDNDELSDEEIKAAESLVHMAFNMVDELGFITTDGEYDEEESRIFFERLKDGCQ
jgi:hypothetical protein